MYVLSSFPWFYVRSLTRTIGRPCLFKMVVGDPLCHGNSICRILYNNTNCRLHKLLFWRILYSNIFRTTGATIGNVNASIYNVEDLHKWSTQHKLHENVCWLNHVDNSVTIKSRWMLLHLQTILIYWWCGHPGMYKVDWSKCFKDRSR